MTFRLKQELKSFIAAEDYALCATLTANRPCTFDELKRYVDIFFTKLDRGIYGKNLLDKNDASNRQKQLHPDANLLWNSRERVGLERNRKGYRNGLHRHVMFERKEAGINRKKEDAETWQSASGIVINIDVNNWEQKEHAKSNRRKVSQLTSRYERAFWHIHFVCTLAQDRPEYDYRRLQRRIERTWKSLKYLYTVAGQADGVIGSCMVKNFTDTEHKQRCFTYITKQISSDTFEKSSADFEIPDAFYYEYCSNTGIERQLTALEKVQRKLRQQAAIGTGTY